MWRYFYKSAAAAAARRAAAEVIGGVPALVYTKAARLTHGRGASGLILCGALRKNVRKLDCD